MSVFCVKLLASWNRYRDVEIATKRFWPVRNDQKPCWRLRLSLLVLVLSIFLVLGIPWYLHNFFHRRSYRLNGIRLVKIGDSDLRSCSLFKLMRSRISLLWITGSYTDVVGIINLRESYEIALSAEQMLLFRLNWLQNYCIDGFYAAVRDFSTITSEFRALYCTHSSKLILYAPQ